MPKIRSNGIELYYELHGPAEVDVRDLSNGVLMSTASQVHQSLVLGFLSKQSK